MNDTISSALADLPWLQRFAVLLARDVDDADDLVQHTLVAAWSRPPADREQPLRPWLATVLRNRFRMQRRAEARREQREAALPAPAPAAADQELARIEVLRALLTELELLAPEDRQIIVRRFFHGESAADISRALAIPAATVRSRLHRSLQRLRGRLDERHGARASWSVVVLAGPSPALPTKASTMSLTANLILLSTTVGALGLAGALCQPGEPEPQHPITAPIATTPTTTPPPRERWEQRRRDIRLTPLPVLPAIKAEPGERDEFRAMIRACLDDLESDVSGAVTIDITRIGAPDIGTIYDSVELVETTVADPEVLQCMLQSMYAWVGEPPAESFERRSTMTFVLGTPATDELKLLRRFEAIIGAHINEVRYCERQGDPNAPEVRGHLLLALTMGPRREMAAPSATSVRDTDLPAATLACIDTASRRWSFPADFIGRTFEYRFTLPIAGLPPRGMLQPAGAAE